MDLYLIKMISHKYNCIFIHVPKNAGMSMVESLKNNSFNHTKGYPNMSRNPQKGRAQKIIASLDKNKWDEYFKFSFCRNPWDRAVSIWKYLNFKSPDVRVTERFEEFKDFLLKGIEIDDHHWKWHYFPQINHIVDEDGNIQVDFIGRFENLQEDFNIVCDKIGMPQTKLPHANKTKHQNYVEYYDSEAKEIVGEVYKKDIEFFGYEFGE